MNTKNIIIKTLLIDDEEGFYNSLKNKAAARSINLVYKKSLQEGLEALRVDKSIRGIILDGRGFIDANQTKGSESTNFVYTAIKEISLLEQKQNQYYAKVVLTAWMDQLKEGLSGQVELFDKKTISYNQDELDRLFSQLRKSVEGSDDLKILNTFRDVFQIIGEPYLDHSQEVKLINILKALDLSKFDNNFNEVRIFLEIIWNRLNKEDLQLLPHNLFHLDGRPNLQYILDFLKGKEVYKWNKENNEKDILHPRLFVERIPPHINDCMEYIKEIGSAISHDYKPNYNHYSYQASVYALLEIILWLKEFIDHKIKK
jgi:hypothetical protein